MKVQTVRFGTDPLVGAHAASLNCDAVVVPRNGNSPLRVAMDMLSDHVVRKSHREHLSH